MGRQTNAHSPTSEPTTDSSTKVEDSAGQSISRRNNDTLEDQRSNPEIRGYMMGLGVQDHVNLQPEATGSRRPGAVRIRPSSNDSLGEETNLEINEEAAADHDLPIVAHLAPDEADMEALWEERRAARMAQETEEHTRQHEMNQTRDGSLLVVDDADIVVVADAIQKNRRKWIMAIFLLLFVVGGVAAFLILQDKKDKEVDGPEALSRSDVPSDTPSFAPSFSPVPVDPLVEELQSWIAPTRKDLLRFLDPTSPQSRALDWLYDDPITLSPVRLARTVVERYVLVVLYYSTSGLFWDYDYLSDGDICTWNIGKQVTNYSGPFEENGAYCVEGGESIGTLTLVGNQLSGTLPWELALLTRLEVMEFSWNSLTGSIPTQIVDMTNLRIIRVDSNALTGSIPAKISQLTRLESFFANENQLTGPLPAAFSPFTLEIELGANSFTGPIPESWGTTMPALQLLNLYENSLTGSFPSIFGRLANLTVLMIDANMLTGPLPATLPANSTVFFLLNNAFTGSIPSTWGSTSMPRLNVLRIDENLVTGTIPSSLFTAMTNLKYFGAGDNNFSGPVPASFPTSVKEVYLASNALTGTIPSTWGGSLPDLDYLAIHANSLTGTIPLSLGQMTTLRTFTFNSNSLTGSVDFLCDMGNWTSLEADCPALVTCSCCTTCHNAG